jgi:hypothetical protein
MKTWGHSDVQHPEVWRGDFASRDKAILDGLVTYSGTFWIKSGDEVEGAQYMPDADQVLDLARDAAEGDAGSDATEDFPNVSEKAAKELDELLQSWAKKHLKATFWVADDEPAEEIQPKE